MAYEDLEAKEERPSRWRSGLLVLPLLLVVGWVLYELTAQPALGVAAVCIKFGWDDFRTAWWLRRRDPDWRRGRACWWLFLASGLWKTAITASLMIFAFIYLKLMKALGRAGPQMVGALLTAFGAIAFAALTATSAVLGAWFFRLKLWLNPAVHTARRHDIWPPPDWPPGRSNLAGVLLGTTWFATGIPLLFIAWISLVFNTLGQPKNNPAAALTLIIGFLAITTMWGLGLTWSVRKVLAPRVFAANPSECWTLPPNPDQAPWTYISDEMEAAKALKL